ncbi:hypothetical protein TK5_02360 [Sideroxyarcus sp. TK5]
MTAHKRHSGRRDLPPEERREHCVSVRLNPRELDDLDSIRGRHTRGEAVRLALFDKLPAPIPAVNADLRANLGRALGNLSTVAVAMRAGAYIESDEIKKMISDLRSALAGGRA